EPFAPVWGSIYVKIEDEHITPTFGGEVDTSALKRAAERPGQCYVARPICRNSVCALKVSANEVLGPEELPRRVEHGDEDVCIPGRVRDGSSAEVDRSADATCPCCVSQGIERNTGGGHAGKRLRPDIVVDAGVHMTDTA